VQTNKTGVIPHVQTVTTNLFTLRKCGITIDYKRFKKITSKMVCDYGYTKHNNTTTLDH
jgi:hypothetical protein